MSNMSWELASVKYDLTSVKYELGADECFGFSHISTYSDAIIMIFVHVDIF